MPGATEPYAITVPEGWFELPCDPANQDAAIPGLVAGRVREVPALAEHRATLAAMLRSIAGDAHASGATRCAALVTGLPWAPLTASLTVSPVASPAPGGDAAAIVARLAPQARGADGTWREVGVVDLPGAGRAARAQGVEDVPVAGRAESVRMVTMRTFVPLPGTDRVALIALSSPDLELAGALYSLFDATTSTFRLVAAAVPA